jgi:hypothetical protein
MNSWTGQHYRQINAGTSLDLRMLLKMITRWSNNADLQAQSDNYHKR